MQITNADSKRLKWVRPMTVCLAALLALAAGCNKGKESSGRKNEEAEAWQTKYESLVRQNEEVYSQLKALDKQNAELAQQVTALKQELERAAAGLEAHKQLQELKQQLVIRDQTIEKLLQEIKTLQNDLSGAAGSSRDQLAELQKKVARARENLIAVGGALLDDGDYEAARGLLAQAVELGAEQPAALSDLAYCHSRLGDEAAAAQCYARAVEAAERQQGAGGQFLAKLYSNYGATLVALGKPQEALAWYLKALQADDKYAAAHFNLGRLYAEHLGDPARAIEHYRRHVALGGSRSVAARAAIQKLLEAVPGATEEKQPSVR